MPRRFVLDRGFQPAFLQESCSCEVTDAGQHDLFGGPDNGGIVRQLGLGAQMARSAFITEVRFPAL